MLSFILCCHLMLSFLTVCKCYHFCVIIFPCTAWVLSFMLSFNVTIFCYHFPPFFFFLKTWHTTLNVVFGRNEGKLFYSSLSAENWPRVFFELCGQMKSSLYFKNLLTLNFQLNFLKFTENVRIKVQSERHCALWDTVGGIVQYAVYCTSGTK